MFENPILERLTHVHPVVPMLIWAPVAAYFFAKELAHGTLPFLGVIGLFASGLFLWSILEYFAHRFAFHFKATTAAQKRFVFLVHGVHHDDPNDATRLLIMPFFSLSASFIFYAIFHSLFGPIKMSPAFSGFIVGYLCYDYIHFATHFVRPRWNWLKNLKQHHLMHHFTTPHRRFGVSNTFWDHVFSTAQ